MATPTPEQIKKLPLWAQEHIGSLERDLRDATTAALQAQESEPSRIDWRESGSGAAKFVPDGATVTFNLGRPRSRIRVMIRDGELDVNGDSSLQIILTGGANAFRVRPQG